tara:strand:- start:943 stop:1164 length:222 start_codon:yes stop_codon:yes gene_type:complete
MPFSDAAQKRQQLTTTEGKREKIIKEQKNVRLKQKYSAWDYPTAVLRSRETWDLTLFTHLSSHWVQCRYGKTK